MSPTGLVSSRRHLDPCISGIAVQIAEQISTLGGPSEVLVSRTVKDLVAGSGLRFADPTTHTLDDIAEPWPLYPVEQHDLRARHDTA